MPLGDMNPGLPDKSSVSKPVDHHDFHTGYTLRKVFYGKFESWYRCREIFISVSSSNPKLGLFKPSLNTDVRKKNGITQ